MFLLQEQLGVPLTILVMRGTLLPPLAWGCGVGDGGSN